MPVESVFGALGDQNRFKIVMQLGEKDYTVDELKNSLAISQSSTSQHLKILYDVGLVSYKKHGNFRIYSLRKEELRKAMHFFDEFWDTGLQKIKMNLEERK